MLDRRKFLRNAAGVFLPAAPALILPRSARAFWQSRDSNYNISPSGGGGGGGGPLLAHLLKGSTTSNSFTTSDPFDSRGATAIVVMLGWYTGGGTSSQTPSDNSGGANTYTQVVVNNFGATKLGMYLCLNPPFTSSSHTFTAGGGTATYPILGAMAFNGTVGSTVDKTSGNPLSSVSSIQPGSVTPTSNNEIIVSAVVTDGQPTTAGAISVNSSMTQPDASIKYDITVEKHFGGGMAWYQQPTAGPINPTWSWPSSATDAVAEILTIH